MAGINGNSSSFCMQGHEQAVSPWPLAFSQTKINLNSICVRLRSSASKNGGRP